MTSRAEIGRALQARLGEYGQKLNVILAREESDQRLGLRDEGQPSHALTEIQRGLMRSEFTPDERARIRGALGIDVLADLGLAALGVPEGAKPGTLAYAQARAEADGSLDSDEDGYDGPVPEEAD
jgi:hypothetical protein